jgi:hypothetical protein
MPSRLIPEDIKWKMQESILLFRLWNYFYSDKIVFASRDTGSLGHRTYLDRSTFHKLYVSDVGEEMSLGSPEKFDKSINSKFNESTPVY